MQNAVKSSSEVQILAQVATPVGSRPLQALLSPETTVERALQAVLKSPPDGAEDRRSYEVLRRETQAKYDVFVILADGHLKKIDIHKTTLAHIAVPREIVLPTGRESLLTTQLQVVQYANVGG